MEKLFDYLIGQLDNPWFWGIIILTLMAIAAIVVIRSQIKKARRPSVYAPIIPSTKRKFRFWNLFRKKRVTPVTGTTTPATPPTPTIREQMRKIFSLFTKWIGKKTRILYGKVKASWQKRITKRIKPSATYIGARFQNYNLYAWIVVIGSLPVGFLLWNVTFRVSGESISLGQCFVAFGLLHLMFGVRRTTVDELVVIDFFGFPLTVVSGEAGMILIGCKTTKFNAKQVQTQYPGEPEQVFWEDEKKDLPPGMVRPVRFSSKMPNNYAKDETDPLKKFRYTFAVSWTVTWQIRKAGVIKFWKNVGSEAEAIKRMRDQSQETLKHEYGLLTPDQILSKTKRTCKRLEKDLEELVGDGNDPDSGWELDIISANIVEDNLGHETTKEQSNLTKAEYQLQVRKKQNLGDGDHEKQLLIGKAEGMKKVQENLKTEEGKLAASITLASETLKNADYAIVPESEIFKTVTSVLQYANRPKNQNPRNNRIKGGNNNAKS